MCRTSLILLAVWLSVGHPLSCEANEINRGQLLIASEALIDPNFEATVLLIIGHDNLGTIALILNRPTKTALNTIIDDRAQSIQDDELVYFGGPVQVQGFRVLASSKTTISNAIHVISDVYFVDNDHALNEVLQHAEAGDKRRFFVGIASWLPGQLQAELDVNAWYVSEFRRDLIFSSNTKEMWPKMLAEMKAQWVQIDGHGPTRPTVAKAIASCGAGKNSHGRVSSLPDLPNGLYNTTNAMINFEHAAHTQWSPDYTAPGY